MSAEADIKKELSELRERVVRLEVKIEELTKRLDKLSNYAKELMITYKNNLVDPYFDNCKKRGFMVEVEVAAPLQEPCQRTLLREALLGTR